MRGILIFCILGGIFLTATHKTEKQNYLTKKEMENILAGVTCPNTYPCKKALHYCWISCSPVGSYCETCIGQGIRYICSNEGPIGSNCTSGIEKEGCGERWKGRCIFPRTCDPKQPLYDNNGEKIYCDREDAIGTPCP